MLILAHRGASADAPENTLPAFEAARAQGADGVELDVQVCGSGELVVCHDERLDRLAGVDWDVRRTPYSKLKTADVGGRLGFGRAHIPLLEEVFGLLPAPMLINVELKCDTAGDGGLARRVGDLVRSSGLADRVVISSFNPLCLVRLAASHPALRRGYLVDPDKSFTWHAGVLAPRLSNHSIHPFHAQITPSRAEAWQRRGLAVAAWTVNDAATAAKLAALGVRYCITDRPGALRAGLASAGPLPTGS